MIFLSFSDAVSITSFLTDGENKTITSLESKKLECSDLGILRQMINQETVIRLTLVKNVHALINDFNLMKQSLASSEATVTELQRTIEVLNLTVNSLQQTNRKLQYNSRISEAKTKELETKLQTVNDNVNIIQEDSDKKRQEFFNKTNSVLDDIKIEVRYLSVTLLDFKECSDSQAEIRRTFTEILNKTVAKHETLLKRSAYEQLKLSSAVALLDAAYRNLSKSNCDTINHHAFTAGISSDNSGWRGDTLVFPVVIYSEGTGYNSSTGIFTAPTSGTYVFYVSVQSAYQKFIRLNIVLNESTKVQVMTWYNSGSSVEIHQTGTNLVILPLRTGDRVWVKRSVDSIGYHSNINLATTFSGFKLY